MIFQISISDDKGLTTQRIGISLEWWRSTCKLKIGGTCQWNQHWMQLWNGEDRHLSWCAWWYLSLESAWNWWCSTIKLIGVLVYLDVLRQCQRIAVCRQVVLTEAYSVINDFY